MSMPRLMRVQLMSRRERGTNLGASSLGKASVPFRPSS